MDGNRLRYRIAPLEMTPSEFRKAGYRVVDEIAEFICTLSERPVAPHEAPAVVREALGMGSLPEDGIDARTLLEDTAHLLFEHSLFNGHPRFMGMITSSASPIGALGDLLASAVNSNIGSWNLAPIATEIEAQTIRWLAEMIGYPTDCSGIMVSGGNMGNFVGLLTARKAKATWDIRTEGLAGDDGGKLCLYTSIETHTWIHKAADLFGLGLDAIRWIPVDGQQKMNTQALRTQIQEDIAAGNRPFLVVGTAGTVSTGTVDPLSEIASICREYNLWFHVDGAYGGLAALLLDNNEGIAVSPELKAIRDADSVAIDPHKWLYAPLEAGCVLVRNAALLRDAFSSHHPSYYHFDDTGERTVDYYEYGLQNSRGFRALKVWLALRQVGREGYVRMMSDDITLSQELYRLIDKQPELQAFTQNLSITTFRYVPTNLNMELVDAESYLNQLNTEILTRIQRSGEAFISNAVIQHMFLLRACIVNFRTSLEDIEALVDLVIRIGKQADTQLRPTELQ
ncbi:MAG TPA: aspartate aminotransferase family protein [Ktedonobacter sp.]|nr:aspartate aminotransferase family protein [Ktedonobacter sp.]